MPDEQTTIGTANAESQPAATAPAATPHAATPPAATDTQWDLWEVFVQPAPGAPHEHCGSVHAADAEQALQNARDVYARRNEGRNLWVIPSTAITASTPEDMGPFFDPANDKPYRHPQFYKAPRGVRLF